MIVIEARYVGPVKVPEWGTWFVWRKYSSSRWAKKSLLQLEKQFRDLYEFRLM